MPIPEFDLTIASTVSFWRDKHTEFCLPFLPSGSNSNCYKQRISILMALLFRMGQFGSEVDSFVFFWNSYKKPRAGISNFNDFAALFEMTYSLK